MLGVFDKIQSDKFKLALKNEDSWLAFLAETGTDPDSPGASYSAVKTFYESGKWTLTAETEWVYGAGFSSGRKDLPVPREKILERIN
jgi:hypothetical protein